MSDLKNWGMVIPTGIIDIFRKPDPNGVPIYDKCPANGEMCACTGACRRILGYDTDPDKVKAYHEAIEQFNALIKERAKSLFTAPVLKSDDGKTRVWTWERKQ